MIQLYYDQFYKIRFKYERNKTGEIIKTVCEISVDGNVLAIGTAKRYFSDPMVKFTARKVALTRALAALGSPKSLRKWMWARFFYESNKHFPSVERQIDWIETYELNQKLRKQTPEQEPFDYDVS